MSLSQIFLIYSHVSLFLTSSDIPYLYSYVSLLFITKVILVA
uniref:Uncharacterized protein n=1 Tax=Arundo donax TaxID=35708 RepID=A0A0A9FZX4_ARUDO